MFDLRLTKLRTDMGITQKELAQRLNIGTRTISDYERGVSKPDIGTLKTLANFFNVSVDYLLGVTEEKNAGSKEVSTALIKYRNMYNLDIAQLSEKIDIPRAYIENWEAMRTMPSFKNMIILSQKLNIPLNQLIGVDIPVNNYQGSNILLDLTDSELAEVYNYIQYIKSKRNL